MPDVKTPWNGGSFFAPSRDEYMAMMRDATAAKERERDRTVKWTSQVQPNTTAGGIYTGVLPESGYVWNLKLVSVQLSASGTCQAFITSSAPSTGSTPGRLITNFGAAATSQVATWSSSQVYLRPDEGLYLLPSTGTVNFWYVTAEQVMSEMQAKVYD